MERAPLALDDVDVTGLRRQLGGVCQPVGGRRPRRIRGVDQRLERVAAIGREAHLDENHRRFGGAEGAGQRYRVGQHGGAVVGRLGIGENALLQVDQHQRRRGSVQFQGMGRGHGEFPG